MEYFFLLKIELFRTIQDNEGHHLTHNFRPIQPLGDRDVYLITTLDDTDNIFGKDDTRIDEPPQNLDHLNSEYKQSTLTESTTYNTIDNNDSNGLNEHPIPEQQQNDIETTPTSHRRPFHRPKGNGANHISQANFYIVIGFCTMLWTIKM